MDPNHAIGWLHPLQLSSTNFPKIGGQEGQDITVIIQGTATKSLAKSIAANAGNIYASDTVDRRHYVPRRVLKKLRSDAGTTNKVNS